MRLRASSASSAPPAVAACKRGQPRQQSGHEQSHHESRGEGHDQTDRLPERGPTAGSR